MSGDLTESLGEEQGPDIGAMLRRVRAIAWRHRWWVVIPTMLAMIPAVSLPFLWPDIYTAVASVEVTSPPEIMDMGGDFMPGEVARSRRAPMSPYFAIALSAQVLGRVVAETPLPPRRESEEPGLLDEALAWLPIQEEEVELTTEQQMQIRIENLRNRVSVYEEDSLLKIQASGVDPAEVARLANAVSDSLVMHSQLRRDDAATEAMSVFNTQVYEYRERIDRRKKEMSDLVARTGIRPEEEQGDPELAAIDTELASVRTLLRDVRLRIAALKEKIERSSGNALEAGRGARLREQYSQAIQDLADARLQYTPAAPQVVRLERLVESLRQQVESVGEAPSPAPPDEVEEYRRLLAQERGLIANEAVLTRERQEIARVDPQRSEALIEYQRLGREMEIDEQQLRELLDRRNKLLLQANSGYATFRILDYAVAPFEPSGPNRKKYILAGCVLAVGLGLGVGFLREMLDQTIRDPDEAASLLHAAVLGMIPRIHDGTPPERQSDGPPSSLAAESYRNLRTALLFASGGQHQGALAVTSATAGEGKTTVCCNLASSFAQAGRRIVLVDADMRLPRVHRAMGMAPAPGLAELIRGDVSLDEALRRPADGRFDVLTAGRVPPNPSELLASSDFVMILARLKAMYDLVLVDCPVLLGVSDACIVGSQVDGALLVHRPGSVEKRALVEIRQQLRRGNVNLVGIAFNQVDRNDRHFYPLYLESPYVSKGKGVRVRKVSRSAARRGAV